MLAQETGIYRERRVIPALQTHFSHVWVHQLEDIPADPFVVAPDGATDLQWIGGRWRIAGPDQSPQLEALPAGSMVIGFHFRPGAASAWLGESLAEFRDARIWLDEIGTRKVRRLQPPGGTHRGFPDMLEGILARQADTMPQPDNAMLLAHGLLSAGPPPGRHIVSWLMDELGLSERTLRRRFDAAFGYGPKTLDRILRFQRYLGLARNRESMARLAAAAGYADQAHLVRECRRLTLHTPARLHFQQPAE